MVGFGSLQPYFAMGAAKGISQMGSMFMSGDMIKPDYNNLYTKAFNETKSGLELRDLQHLQKTLNDIEPKLFNDFKRNAKKLGEPAKKDVRKAFMSVDKTGPLGPIRRPGRTFDKMANNLGRLTWSESRSKRNTIDVNYKARSAAQFKRASLANDKTLSVIRVRVRGPAFVVADMAGKSMKARKRSGQLSREYSINAFGKGIVTRRHKISSDNVDNWIDRLNGSSSALKGHPSRYAWPAFEKHAKEYRSNFSALVNQTIAETNRRMQS